MNTDLLLKYSMFAQLIVAASVLVLIVRKKLLGDFFFLAAFAATGCIEEVLSITLLFFWRQVGIKSPVLDYQIYFYSHWALFFIEYSLLLLVIYSVFQKAMKPLQGLHRAGKIVFRWVGCVSVAISLALAMSPQAHGQLDMARLAGQMQQGINVLILCLLLFVCLSTRYLGLTFRSHIFGVSLGLGVFATAGLVEAAWLSTAGAQSLYSPVYAISALATCVSFLVWGAYFALPEPERKMILLPTTSPYFLWNAISEALGDDPGFVAIAGFKPEMLAPAELTAMTAASRWARERDEALEREAIEEILAKEAQIALNRQQTMAFHSIALPQ